MERIDELRTRAQRSPTTEMEHGALHTANQEKGHPTQDLDESGETKVPIIEPETDHDDDLLNEDLDTTGADPVRVKPKSASLRLQTRGGRMRADQDQIKAILKTAIVNMCNSGLYYQSEMRIEGLLGITLDRREIIMVNVHDIVRTSESEEDTKVPYAPTIHKRKMTRPWRVAGRQYVKRGPGRRPKYDTGAPLVKRRRKLEDEEDDEPDMSIFGGLAPLKSNSTQNTKDGEVNEQPEEGAPPNPEDRISNLAQAVAWYSGVDDEARNMDGEVANDHGLPLPDPMASPAKADMIRFLNEEVGRGYAKKQEKKKKRGEYNNYTAEMRAKIGQYAVEHGIGKAMRHFKVVFGRPISESTVRCMRKAYLDAKRETQADEVVVLPKKDRGRPLMLKEYDTDVMEYLDNLKRNGAQINAQIVMDAARGVLLHKDKNRLKEFGGEVEISKAWAQSFMARKGLHGLGRRKRMKTDGPKPPRKKKEKGGNSGANNQGQTSQHPQQQQQQQQVQQQQQQQPHSQLQQMPPQHPGMVNTQPQQLSQHPTPVHTPHPQDHDSHLHNMDVITPPPAHQQDQRSNTMVFPERQMHGGDPMHDPRNPMVFSDRQPHPSDHPMHDHTGRMVFPDRHAMAGLQDPHHMFFPERLNLNPVPAAHCSLWPSQNLHHKNN